MGAGETTFAPFDRRDLDGSIVARFERQVDARPDALAVESPRDRLTYAELDALSNRIACDVLERAGVGSGPVALLLEQSGLLIAAILGVLKAGKIYVPLDARHPRARLSRIVEDAAPALVLCDHDGRAPARTLAPPGAPILILDRLVGAGRPGVAVAPDSPAYIYHTSGSTGLPKGVVDSHRNILHNVMRYTNGLRVRAPDRLSLVQSCAFSGCVSTQFTALLNGASLHLFDVQAHGFTALAAWLRAQRISMFHGVPVLFRGLAEAAGELPDLRLVRLEGDKAAWSDVEIFKSLCRPGALLVNGLGTTETGIVRRLFLDHDAPVDTGPLPLGYAVEDMELLLQDPDGSPVPPGEVGEIAIRSEYLAAGYWRQPERTARAFIASPGGAARTYRTGDLGRLRDDGCLEYVGRRDLHRKVRGEFVAIDVIERTLLAQPGVRQAVVLTREGGDDARVIAYVVPEEGVSLDPSGLRRVLGSELPASSVPSAVLAIERLPLSEHGKVDLRALPSPGRQRPLDTPYAAPCTPLEWTLSRLWADLLQLDVVGRDDDFLDIGGNSLLAARVQTRLHALLGIDLPLRALFDSPTVASLASVIEERTRVREPAGEPAGPPRQPIPSPPAASGSI